MRQRVSKMPQEKTYLCCVILGADRVANTNPYHKKTTFTPLHF